MRNSIAIVLAVAASAVCHNRAEAATLLALGDNRNAIYTLNYNGSATTAGNWNASVGLYARLNLAATESAYSLTRDAGNNVYLSTVLSAGGGRILKIAPDGTQTTLAERGSAAATSAGWTTANANGMAMGPDGRIYFSTAFGAGSTQGVFAVNTDGTGLQQFISAAGNPAIPEDNLTLPTRDLVWAEGKLWLTHRTGTGGTTLSLYRYSETGAFEASFNTFGVGSQSITYASDGFLFVGGNVKENLVRRLKASDPSVRSSAVHNTVATGAANAALGLVDSEGQVLFSDYNVGTGGTSQIRFAPSNPTAATTGAIVYTFNGRSDPASLTGGLMDGFRVTDMVVIPEPVTLTAALGGLIRLRTRRR